MASLPTFLTAPSPRSSPRATLILSAASTNSSIWSFAVMPSLPASPASAFSCSRLVRVSIFFRLSLSASTSSLERPVYLRTCAIASSIWANSLTDCWRMPRTPLATPKKACTFMTRPIHLLPHSARRSLHEARCVSRSSRLTSVSAALVSRMALVSACHSAEPRCTLPELSSFWSSRRVRFSSFGADLSRFSSARVMVAAFVSVRSISRSTFRSSLE